MDTRINLLVADDEALVRDFIRSMVRKEKLPVADIREADNGLEAVRLALAEKPDLAILDIRMPGLSGLEAGAEILARLPETMVCIVSAYDEFDYARQAFKAGACDYLLKPVRPGQIAEIVTRAAEKRGRTEAVPAGPPHLVRAVSDYVEANLDQPLPLEDIARAVFVSPCHLSRKFKSLSGRSLTAFIQERRLRKAAELLLATEASVTEVAGQVGFNNPSYFATCFKAALGQTPFQYRKVNRP